METIDIITAILMFMAAMLGTMTARLFNPGVYLTYAQTFASGSFIGISLLHFLPIAVRYYDPSEKWPMYSIIMASIFIILSLFETSQKGEHNDRPSNSSRELSDDNIESHSVFLMHNLAVIPSFWMRLAVLTFMVVHSVIIGLVMSFGHEKLAHVSILIATLIEKMIEAFTVTIMIRKDLTRAVWFWILILTYAVITPATVVITSITNFHENSTSAGLCMSISAGVFLFVGLLLWKRTFMTPFEWRKKEILAISLIFIASITLEALACFSC